MSKFDELSPAQSEMIEVLAYEYYSYPEEEIAGVTGWPADHRLIDLR